MSHTVTLVDMCLHHDEHGQCSLIQSHTPICCCKDQICINPLVKIVPKQIEYLLQFEEHLLKTTVPSFIIEPFL